MFYEEKIINGVLCARTSPDAVWRTAKTPHTFSVNELLHLTDEERKTVFGFFCTHCGSADSKCQCWNDE
jgi:hypothetical protein